MNGGPKRRMLVVDDEWESTGWSLVLPELLPERRDVGRLCETANCTQGERAVSETKTKVPALTKRQRQW